MIKKILIGFIIILVIIFFLCFNLIVKDKFGVTNKNNTKEIVYEEEASMQNDTVIQSGIIENETNTEVKQNEKENTEEKPLISSITDKQTQTKESKKTQDEKVDTIHSNTTIANVSNQETKAEEIKDVQNTINLIETTKEEPKQTKENTETRIPVVPVIPKPEVTEEKYVRNDTMINRIRQTINNNPSEYMLEYGYEIVVDSSIKEHTNQFTFTENRVKGYITYKFGTIRIYAEDYIRNGQLIMTECYIY